MKLMCGVFCVCEVKRFVRKGVPNEHRAKIWMAASGAQEQLENHQGYYQSLLAVEHDPKLKETIHIGEPQRDYCQAQNVYGLQGALQERFK